MVTADELGNQPMSIQSISVKATASSDSEGSYENFVLLMGHTSLIDLTATFDDNWATSGTEMLTDANLEIAGLSGDQWISFDFSQPFLYDGSSNLLMEIVWDGPSPAPSGTGSIYTWCWLASSNRTVAASSASSSTGTPGTICQMLLVSYETALDQMTFAGIKGSF